MTPDRLPVNSPFTHTSTEESLFAELRSRALTQLTAGQPIAALRYLSDLLALDPNHVATLLTLGDCYLAGQDISGAQAFYERAAAIAPDNATARQRRALAFNAQLAAGSFSNTKQVPTTWLSESGFPLGSEAVYKWLWQMSQNRKARSVGELLNTILRSPDPSDAVRANLDEVLACLPTLINLSASQAEVDGNSERAQLLTRLADLAAA